MKLYKYKPHIVLLLLFLTVGCSSFKGQKHQVVLKQDARVTMANGEVKILEKDKQVTLDEGAVLIESEGHTGVLVVPVNKNPQSVEVRLKKLESKSLGNSLQYIYDSELTTILTEVYLIQKFIKEKKVDDALKAVEKLRTEFPHVTYLKFLEASIYMVKGNRAKTKTILEEALSAHPENKVAMDLYQSLLKKGEVNRFISSEDKK